jgi:hypothetical protein
VECGAVGLGEIEAGFSEAVSFCTIHLREYLQK